MSQGVNLNELQSEAERLVALLKDRQPGLYAWNRALSQRLETIRRLINEADNKAGAKGGMEG